MKLLQSIYAFFTSPTTTCGPELEPIVVAPEPVKPVDTFARYRPMLDLLGKSEGTDKGRGYNETLSYGAYTGGDVNLVSMTLREIRTLQTKMLANPKNKWNSSALGRYQIVRKTLIALQQQLALPDTMTFSESTQDRLAVQLMKGRGIDKWLAGLITQDQLINSLAQEWASLPTTKGKGYYSGQNSSVSVAQVKAALNAIAAY
jgi:muramidase (phage lysozyme)